MPTFRRELPMGALFPYVLYLLIAVILFSPFFLRGEAFLAADVLSTFEPWKSQSSDGLQPRNWALTDPVLSYYPNLYNDALKRGSLPLWNPHIFMGTPAHMSIGMGQPGRYSPLKLLLHRLLPTTSALNSYLLLNVLLMGCFMHLYLTRIKASLLGSLFGSVTYMLNGYAMVWLEFESWVATAALLPLLLLLLEGFAGSNRLRHSFGAALTLGLIILAGNVQLTLYVGLFMLCYVALLINLRGGGFKEAARMTGCLGIAMAGGVAVGGIEILPFLELASESFRHDVAYDFDTLFAQTAHVPWRYFITLLYPYFFGSPVHPSYVPPTASHSFYMNYNELCIYMGVTGTIVFVAAAASRKSPRGIFYLAAVLLISLMAAGTVLYWPIYALVPGMDRINPSRLLFLYSFSFAAFCGLGLDRIGRGSPRRRHATLAAAASVGLVMIFVAVLGGSEWFTRWINHEAIVDAAPRGDIVSALMSFRSITSPVIAMPFAIGMTSLLLVVAAALFPHRPLSKTVLTLLIVLTAFDLLSFAKRYNTTSDPDLLYPREPALAFLERQDRPFRVLMVAGDFFSSTMHSNTLAPFGIDEIGGYSSLYPKRVNQLLSYIRFRQLSFSDGAFTLDVSFDKLSSHPLLNLLNMRFILAAPQTPVHHTAYSEVHDNALVIYENAEALPRAFVVHRHVLKKGDRDILSYMGSSEFDISGEVVLEERPEETFLQHVWEPKSPSTATVMRYNTDTVEISANLRANGWLVLTDTYYPGWVARVNGTEVPVYAADLAFRAVPLKAGSSHVVFTYEPTSVRLGFLCSAIGFIAAAGGLLGSTFHRRRAASNRI